MNITRVLSACAFLLLTLVLSRTLNISTYHHPALNHTTILPSTNTSNSPLGIWPGSPFREYIYEPDEYISIEESEPDIGDQRAILVALAQLPMTICSPSTDDKPFTQIHATVKPVEFDLRTTDASITGWKVYEILSVVFNMEVRYGTAEFKAVYVKDYDELAEFSVMLVPSVAEE